MRKRSHQILAALASVFVLTTSAVGSTVTYSVSGTFSDGGTFSGTFGYDPVANSFEADGSITGQFDIITTAGSVVNGQKYVPGVTTGLGFSDVLTPPAPAMATGLYIDGCCFMGTQNLILDWNTPLNSPEAGLSQTIVGGSETYQPFYEFPDETRQVESGTITLQASPVPLPAALWLMLSGCVGLFASVRRRRRDSLVSPSTMLNPAPSVPSAC